MKPLQFAKWLLQIALKTQGDITAEEWRAVKNKLAEVDFTGVTDLPVMPAQPWSPAIPFINPLLPAYPSTNTPIPPSPWTATCGGPVDGIPQISC